jgi:AmmeMemoRadiSam system protein B
MESSVIRTPAVAGQFYPSNREALTKALENYLGPEVSPAEIVPDAIACIVPHAGYMYSGHVAGAVYRRLPFSSSYLILCPNHFGNGQPLAIMSRGYWQTPLGLVPLDEALAETLQQNCSEITEDAEAHSEEHSLEVQIPFLQQRVRNFSFVPLAIGAVGYERLMELGQGIAKTLKNFPKPVFVIASSDMNHYEPDRMTRGKDRKAIERILAFDPAGLYEVLRREKITMCGYGPAIAMLTAVKELGAREALLEKYATSADAGGSVSSVVGYAGIIIRGPGSVV